MVGLLASSSATPGPRTVSIHATSRMFVSRVPRRVERPVEFAREPSRPTRSRRCPRLSTVRTKRDATWVVVGVDHERRDARQRHRRLRRGEDAVAPPQEHVDPLLRGHGDDQVGMAVLAERADREPGGTPPSRMVKQVSVRAVRPSSKDREVLRAGVGDDQVVAAVARAVEVARGQVVGALSHAERLREREPAVAEPPQDQDAIPGLVGDGQVGDPVAVQVGREQGRGGHRAPRQVTRRKRPPPRFHRNVRSPDVRSAVTRSVRPSPSRSAATSETGSAPTASAGPSRNVPSPVPYSTVTASEAVSATAMSRWPSPLKSPATRECGDSPTE